LHHSALLVLLLGQELKDRKRSYGGAAGAGSSAASDEGNVLLLQVGLLVCLRCGCHAWCPLC
jgi:hypothetical protein